METETTAPISRDEAARLLAGIEDIPHLVLAVSGGPDSMALMLLVARWAKDLGTKAPAIEVVTIDHGLRPGSSREAEFVAKAAQKLGLRHSTLAWRGEKPAAGLQEAARKARYAQLVAHAHQLAKSPVAILTAHTEEDQAETVLMRLARGSGVDGLAAMAPSRRINQNPEINLHRPLIGIAKSRLAATLRAQKLESVDDPSNEQTRFERVRIRQAASTLDQLGLDPPHLALSAKRLQRAKAALDAVACDAFVSTVDLHGGVFATIDRNTLTLLPDEIQLRVLIKSLQVFTGTSNPPRLSQIENLLEALTKTSQPRHAQTLGGAMISAGSRIIRIYREPNRANLTAVTIRPGQTIRWDGRFLARLSNGPKAAELDRSRPVIIRPLGRTGLKSQAHGTSIRQLPARALETLPAFLSGSKLLAVPSLSRWVPELAGPAETTGVEVCTAAPIAIEGPQAGEHRNNDNSDD